MRRVVLLGLGNIGFWLAAGFGLLIRQAGNTDSWQVVIVDHDTVDDAAVRKGYPEDLVGTPKPAAVVEVLLRMYGAAVASCFRPVCAAIECAPGLLRDPERALFSAVDSYGDAEWASRQAAGGGWQCRVATEGGAEGRAAHVVHVLPNAGSLADLYDDAAWRHADDHGECLTGLPHNAFAGAAHPLGMVPASLAIQAYLDAEDNGTPYRIELRGARATRSEITLDPRPGPASRALDVGYDRTLPEVWAGVAEVFGASPSSLAVDWDLPFVRRRCGCGTVCSFERYPVTGICARCGSRSVLDDGGRQMSFEEAQALGGSSLGQLSTPAGMGFTAGSEEGRVERFHLPFSFEDIPLQEGRADDDRSE